MVGPRIPRESIPGVEDVQNVVRKIRHRLNEDGEDLWFAGEASEQAVDEAERSLEVSFPPDYRYFVENIGAGRIDTIQFFGVIAGVSAHSSAYSRLDVVRKTKDMIESTDLPANFVVVHSDTPRTVHAIDIADADEYGQCPVARFPSDFHRPQEPNFIARSFGEFLKRAVAEALGERPKDWGR